MGLAQLMRYQSMLKRRHEIISRYDDAFKNENMSVLEHAGENYRSSGHLYFIRPTGISEDARNDMIKKLAEKGIASNVHYKPLPMLTAYKNMGFDIEDYPNSYNYYRNEITLPLYSRLTDEQVDYIIEGVKGVMREYE